MATRALLHWTTPTTSQDGGVYCLVGVFTALGGGCAMFSNSRARRRFTLTGLDPVRALAPSLVVVLSVFATCVSPSRGEELGRRAAINEALDPSALAAHIDAYLNSAWQTENVTPAAPATDAEFVRRAYLDVVGKIPSVAEVRAFLADQRADKRRRLVEDLLHRGSHAAHMANVWREVLLPGALNNPDTRALGPPLEAWLRLRFAAETPYDQLAAELLTPSAVDAAPAPGAVVAAPSGPSPAAFFQFNERKPENLATSTARVFLGTQVGCAQCHDHPFAKWRREEFWALAAFFGGASMAEPADMDRPSPDSALSIKIPDTEPVIVVAARFLDGSSPQALKSEDPRQALIRWITSGENHYFARAAVNRVWEQFFGRGFVDPVDDLDEANPPVHPELFDEIARQFTLHGYDFKYLIRTITATRAYQLSSRTGAATGEIDPFARMRLRRMTAEQLYDSLVEATGYRDTTAAPQPGVLFGNERTRDQFLAKFGDQSARRSESQTSILQALSLMNGGFTAEATDLERSRTLSAVAESPFLDTAGRIETLFLAALARPPEPDESDRLVAYVSAAGDEAGQKQALSDIYWALLNSAEFIFNH